MNPLILVDGSSYFFRAFHALPRLANSKGDPTGAIYGVASMIKKLMKDYAPARVVVVFDAKGKTFRDDLYPAYKANRPPMPDDLIRQFHPLLDLLRAMGLPILLIPGVEADDVIGTLAQQAYSQNIPVIISTGDKDMAQLVCPGITLVNTMTNQVLDDAGVMAKFGVSPQQIIDYLTLVGDTSDNVPGVPKCGPKTAVKWLQEYQTLDNIVTQATNFTGKVGENLREFLPQLPLSKQLVTIKTDVELPVQLEELAPIEAKHEILLDLVREFEFKTWLKELLAKNPVQAQDTTPNQLNVEIINNVERLRSWLRALPINTPLCIHIKTIQIDPVLVKIIGVALAINDVAPVYIPIAHQVDASNAQLALEVVLSVLKPVLENRAIAKVGHDLKSTYKAFKQHGVCIQGILADTLLSAYLLNSARGDHTLASLAQQYLTQTIASYHNKVVVNFTDLTIALAASIAGEEAVIILELYKELTSRLPESLLTVLKTIEIPMLTILADMELHGVLIDDARLALHGKRLKVRLRELETAAYELAGKTFNLSSPQQLRVILFDELKLPVIAKTPTGQPSTAESTLQELAVNYPLAAIILEYRSLSKLVSTYIDALPKCINANTHRVHTSYNQAVTSTGRLSSSDPNLQNIPIRSEEGRLIRKAFIAPPNNVLLAADYSQIELRIMAHLSQDPNLQYAFLQGWDVHAATASELFAVALEDVTDEQRRRAKAVNFGLIYGMSAFGLAKQLGIARQDAQYYIDRYFERYPGVWSYMERTRHEARSQGYVETLFGRRLYLPEINHTNKLRRQAAERMAINAPMQGTAADIIKKAMITLAAWQQTNDSTYMMLQVHDELVFEVQASALDDVRAVVREHMEHAVELSVPLLVSMGVGTDWDLASSS